MSKPVTRAQNGEEGFAFLLSPALYALQAALADNETVDLIALASHYVHPMASDLIRVRENIGLTSDEAAKLWLLRRAAREFDNVCLDLDENEASSQDTLLLVRGRPLPPQQVDQGSTLRSPFNVDMQDAVFAENIRKKIDLKKLDELRESMRTFGWIPYHPAILDERGTVIIGHRRLHVAKELGVAPDIVRVSFGRGDKGDAERLRLAIASNLGNEPLNAEDRKKIAGRLYSERNAKGEPIWSLTRIAEVLNVAVSTVYQDVKAEGVGKGTNRGRGGNVVALPAPKPDTIGEWIKARVAQLPVPTTDADARLLCHDIEAFLFELT